MAVRCLEGPGDLRAVASARLEAGPSRPLFTTEMNMTWASHADGSRFILGKEPGGRARPTTLIVDWPALVEK